MTQITNSTCQSTRWFFCLFEVIVFMFCMCVCDFIAVYILDSCNCKHWFLCPAVCVSISLIGPGLCWTGCQSPSSVLVFAEPLSDRPGSVPCRFVQIWSVDIWSMQMWSTPDDDPHCRAQNPAWMVVYQGSVWQMTTQLPGWIWWRKKHSRNEVLSGSYHFEQINVYVSRA